MKFGLHHIIFLVLLIIVIVILDEYSKSSALEDFINFTDYCKNDVELEPIEAGVNKAVLVDGKRQYAAICVGKGGNSLNPRRLGEGRDQCCKNVDGFYVPTGDFIYYAYGSGSGSRSMCGDTYQPRGYTLNPQNGEQLYEFDPDYNGGSCVPVSPSPGHRPDHHPGRHPGRHPENRPRPTPHPTPTNSLYQKCVDLVKKGKAVQSGIDSNGNTIVTICPKSNLINCGKGYCPCIRTVEECGNPPDDDLLAGFGPED